MSVTYSSYLALDELLRLQRPRSGSHFGADPTRDPSASLGDRGEVSGRAEHEVSGRAEHDEMLFIVIHQVYELWFRQVLHEFEFLGEHFEAHRLVPHPIDLGAEGEDPDPVDDRTSRVLHTLKRVLTILKTMVAQVDVLETMTPLSFSSFRSRLASSSGFQSPQFRELEFLLGYRRPKMMGYHRDNPRALAALERRMGEPTLYQRFLRFVARSGHEVPAVVWNDSPDEPLVALPEVQPLLIDIYRLDGTLAQVCERLVDFDEGLQEWRYRHVKMVERTIGMKAGTGGSAGVEYLAKTLFKPLFPDLWAIRSEL